MKINWIDLDKHWPSPDQKYCNCDWCRFCREQDRKPALDPSVVDVGTITEYGLTQKLSQNVRVF